MIMDLALPAAGTFLYLSYPWNGSLFISIHNLSLHLFSLWTFSSLLYYVWQNGLHAATAYYFADPRIERVIFYFYLSKYYEYFDTFILYGKGKQPIFLQKYHHVGAVICWHLAWQYKVDAIVFASMFNAFIHSIMYLYYLATFHKVNLNYIKPYITYMQMFQFITGFISSYAYYPIETFTNRVITLIFLTYNAGLMLLFGKFIKDNY